MSQPNPMHEWATLVEFVNDRHCIGASGNRDHGDLKIDARPEANEDPAPAWDARASVDPQISTQILNQAGDFHDYFKPIFRVMDYTVSEFQCTISTANEQTKP